MDKVIYQNWFWMELVEFVDNWQELLDIRLINYSTKTCIYQILTKYDISECFGTRTMLSLEECSSCYKRFAKKNLHFITYGDFCNPKRISVVCNHWKCRYAAIVGYYSDYLHEKKYLCYRPVLTHDCIDIPRSSGEKTIGNYCDNHVTLINNKCYILTYWDETNRDMSYKYVPIETYRDNFTLEDNILKLSYHHKSLTTCPNYKLLK